MQVLTVLAPALVKGISIGDFLQPTELRTPRCSQISEYSSLIWDLDEENCCAQVALGYHLEVDKENVSIVE